MADPVTIIMKDTWHTELEKEYPYEPERPQNHDTKQVIEHQKETETNIKKKQAKPSVGTTS